MLLSNTFYHGEGAIAMTTDEIAEAVQAGEADILELWRAVERFAKKQALRWCRAWEGRGGVVLDDLMQASFLSLLDALASWKSDGGTFIGLYAMKLKTAFATVYGQRTERERRDPLQYAISLETPLEDSNEELTVADTVPDPAAELAFDDVSEADRVQRLHEALETALETLPEPQKTAVVKRYYMDEKADSKALNAALRALRHPSISKGLRGFL